MSRSLERYEIRLIVSSAFWFNKDSIFSLRSLVSMRLLRNQWSGHPDVKAIQTTFIHSCLHLLQSTLKWIIFMAQNSSGLLDICFEPMSLNYAKAGRYMYTQVGADEYTVNRSGRESTYSDLCTCTSIHSLKSDTMSSTVFVKLKYYIWTILVINELNEWLCYIICAIHVLSFQNSKKETQRDNRRTKIL